MNYICNDNFKMVKKKEMIKTLLKRYLIIMTFPVLTLLLLATFYYAISVLGDCSGTFDHAGKCKKVPKLLGTFLVTQFLLIPSTVLAILLEVICIFIFAINFVLIIYKNNIESDENT